jgi:hypothetical protein
MVYAHPHFKYNLKRYALARGAKVKVLGLLIETLEQWAERQGSSGPVRVLLSGHA